MKLLKLQTCDIFAKNDGKVCRQKVTRSRNPVKWLAVRTRQNGKLLNSQKIIKCHPPSRKTRARSCSLPFARRTLPSSLNSHRESREHYESVTPLCANISSLVEGPRISRRGSGRKEERRQCAQIIARNDLLFSRPIKSAICWRSEREKRRGS